MEGFNLNRSSSEIKPGSVFNFNSVSVIVSSLLSTHERMRLGRYCSPSRTVSPGVAIQSGKNDDHEDHSLHAPLYYRDLPIISKVNVPVPILRLQCRPSLFLCNAHSSAEYSRLRNSRAPIMGYVMMKDDTRIRHADMTSEVYGMIYGTYTRCAQRNVTLKCCITLNLC